LAKTMAASFEHVCEFGKLEVRRPMRHLAQIFSEGLDVVLSKYDAEWLIHSQLLLGQWLLAIDYLIRHVSSFELEKSSLLALFFIPNLGIRVRDHRDGVMVRNLRLWHSYLRGR
jgi:hypothetical protein